MIFSVSFDLSSRSILKYPWKGLDMIQYRNILFMRDLSQDANIALLHALGLAKKHTAKKESTPDFLKEV
jgi:hypothetical protein